MTTKLMKISKYLETRYVKGGGPTAKSIRDRIANGSLPGEKEGGLWYVHVDDQLNPVIQPRQHSQQAISHQSNAITQLIEEFKTHYLPQRKLAARSLQEKQIKLRKYQNLWGTTNCHDADTRLLSEYTNTLSPAAYIKHRALLIELFTFSISQGMRTPGMGNPAMFLIAKTPDRKVRERHTLDGYQAIHQCAPEWLQRAMDIALYSLQRRADITRMHRNQVNIERNTLTVLQHKSENWSEPVFIEIEMGADLRSTIVDCIQSDIPCPYLIHYRPKRLMPKATSAKLHPFAVNDDHLTKEFKRCRDESGAYDHLTPRQRPTFHEIRALGTWLYQQAGFEQEYIQALSGHSTEKMLEHYQTGHEKPEPKKVKAGLSLG